MSTNNKANPDQIAEWNALLKEASEFPLFSALYGRRSRRFGWGMEIPRGPLQFKSDKPPAPLDDFETSLLLAAGLGVSGLHFGIPYSDAEPGLATYAARYTGRTLPTAAGNGNPELFYMDDSGTYFVSTRDATTDGKLPVGSHPATTPNRIIGHRDTIIWSNHHRFDTICV
jgi:hypothetical protein